MSQPLNLAQARFNMIEQQIRPWDVLDADILALLNEIHREDYLPLASKALAFVDMEVPLPAGQSMLAPRVEARALQDLKVQKNEKVLEIGTGSGFMAALLAHRAQRVISLEIKPELAEFARGNLQKAGVSNVEVRVADGARDVQADGPFDVIVLSGSVAEVPAALLDQLKVGGRLFAIVGYEPVMRATFITRNSDKTFSTVQPWDTVAARLHNFPEPSRFKL
ncbi:protein-L-isoaspartate O-methyltransferase family protein [Curvibacter microcysteis]|uniref:protein-L-isoaspartate O-methyltransferase family protein n=1 Tax=Curvibacter microcysteis TaxID=3026419 RepID=UPI003906878F